MPETTRPQESFESGTRPAAMEYLGNCFKQQQQQQQQQRVGVVV